MGCCIALALIIGLVRLAWFRLVRGEAPERTGFAPPARRPGPGAAVPVGPAGVSYPAARAPSSRADTSRAQASSRADTSRAQAGSRPAPDRDEVRRPSSGPVLALAAITGFGLYSVVLALLTRAGVVSAMAHDMSSHRRDLVLIGGAVVAVVVALALRLHRPAPTVRGRHLGLILTGAGSAWSLLSVLDMHVTGMVAAHHTDVLADLTLHGPGILALVLGAGLLLTGARRPNPFAPTTTRGTS